MDYFPDASTAKTSSRNNLIIFNEVTAIQKAVLTAINNGYYTVTVSNTTMTTTTSYYDVWKYDSTTVTNYDALQDQMTTVIDYFTNLDYTISQIDNSGTFSWLIQW